MGPSPRRGYCPACAYRIPGNIPFMPRIIFCHAAFGKLLHHFLRLLELIEQAIHFLHRYASTCGDTPLARWL
jgi:hypothetical protein